MKIENINVNESIEIIKKQMALDKSISPAIKSSIDLLILIVGLMGNRLHINSANSSKPPSQDPNRPRKTRLDKGLKRDKKKQGGQVGHPGSTLEKIETPNEGVSSS